MPDGTPSTVKIFADVADLDVILRLAREPIVKGFTTNPTLMWRSGITDYEGFAQKILENVAGRPVSFEVFSDDFAEMERQARVIASWHPNVYVKIPVMNTRAESTEELIRVLSADGVRLNVTALLSLEQVDRVAAAMVPGALGIISIFAGRIADTGRDPVPVMRSAAMRIAPHDGLELLWASSRELYNLVQAEESGCDIITLTDDLLRKVPLLGRDLEELSLETVRMFHRDACAAGYVL